MNIRSRLQMINSDNNEAISLYNTTNATNSFKYTATFIMMPYINNNKIVAIHSFQ